MKVCSKCGNNKLIEGVKYCLNCGADLEKNKSENVKCCVKNKTDENVNENEKCLVKTRLSVELFEIF